MSGSLKSSRVTTLVAVENPQKVRIETVRKELEATRDQIGALDLEIEDLRGALMSFEALYRTRLAREHRLQTRIDALLRHAERWADLLRPGASSAEGQGSVHLSRSARGVEQRREQELADLEDDSEPESWPDDHEASVLDPEINPPIDRETLKRAYHALARRFHPDLARTEAERLSFSETMARINELYRAGDAERLLDLQEQAKGSEIDDLESDPGAALQTLESRLNWFHEVLKNLKEERIALERSDICRLWRNSQQATNMGRDLLAELQEDMQTQVAASYRDIEAALNELEHQVARYNRQVAPVSDGRSGQRSAVLFDPFANSGLVRQGLQRSKTLRASAESKAIAAEYETLAEKNPATLRLVLLAYVSELSPFPLGGLQDLAGVERRYRGAAQCDEDLEPLPETLLRVESWIEFGVKHVSETVAYTGLRFRSRPAYEAVNLALPRFSVRRCFGQVLRVLGDHVRCTECDRDVFSIPLFRLRGLENLRATVCVRCGHTLSKYWLPKGDDVQSVLNHAYVDHAIIEEWSFRLGRISIGTQRTPEQARLQTIGDLKQQWVRDVFERHEIEIKRGHVHLYQNKKRVKESTPLAEMSSQRLIVRFSEKCPYRESEAVEKLKYRIRNRFRAD